jgi:predicted Zn-dependent protease
VPKNPIYLLLVLLSLAGCAVNPVTGKTEFSLVSEAQEIQLGTENYAYMQQSGGGQYDVDPELSAYVQVVGGKLAAVSDRQLPYEFVVLNSSVPNAWALPGGKIAINRGCSVTRSYTRQQSIPRVRCPAACCCRWRSLARPS